MNLRQRCAEIPLDCPPQLVNGLGILLTKEPMMVNTLGISSDVLDELTSLLIATPVNDACYEEILGQVLDAICATNDPHRDITNFLDELTEVVADCNEGHDQVASERVSALVTRWEGVLTTIPEVTGLPRGVHVLPRVRPLLLAASRLLLRAWQEADDTRSAQDLETIYRTCKTLWTQVVGWIILDEGTVASPDIHSPSDLVDLEVTIHTRLLQEPLREHRGTLIAIPTTPAWYCTQCAASIAPDAIREGGDAHCLLPAYARSWDAARIVLRMVLHDADLRAAFLTIRQWPQEHGRDLSAALLRLTPEQVCRTALLAYLRVNH